MQSNSHLFHSVKVVLDASSITFLNLNDTPAAYTGKSLQFVRVNSGESALEFATGAEVLSHADLDDMPDVGGTVADHDARYYTETEIDTTLTDYLKKDGTIALTGNWDAGSFKITAETFESDVATGTAPFTVASTTLVTNLNADLLDGKNTGTSGNVIPLLDGANTWSGIQTYSAEQDFGANFVDYTEMTTPANPSANIARMYCRDATGTTKLYFRDSAGTETELGGGGGSPGGSDTQVQYNNASSFGGIADLTYDGTDITLGGIAGTTKLFFRDTGIFIHSNVNGELTIEADSKVTIGVAGDIVLGDSTLRVLKPQTTAKIDLGTASFKFNDAFFAGTISGGIQTATSDANVANPPTIANINAAFDTAANKGDGFIGVIDDNGAGTNVWLVVSDGTNWWYEALTKAV